MAPDFKPLTFGDWLPMILCVIAGGVLAVAFVLSAARVA